MLSMGPTKSFLRFNFSVTNRRVFRRTHSCRYVLYRRRSVLCAQKKRLPSRRFVVFPLLLCSQHLRQKTLFSNSTLRIRLTAVYRCPSKPSSPFFYLSDFLTLYTCGTLKNIIPFIAPHASIVGATIVAQPVCGCGNGGQQHYYACRYHSSSFRHVLPWRAGVH